MLGGDVKPFLLVEEEEEEKLGDGGVIVCGLATTTPSTTATTSTDDEKATVERRYRYICKHSSNPDDPLEGGLHGSDSEPFPLHVYCIAPKLTCLKTITRFNNWMARAYKTLQLNNLSPCGFVIFFVNIGKTE